MHHIHPAAAAAHVHPSATSVKWVFVKQLLAQRSLPGFGSKGEEEGRKLIEERAWRMRYQGRKTLAEQQKKGFAHLKYVQILIFFLIRIATK